MWNLSCPQVTPQSLGIHPRDLSLFQTGSRMAIQRATIAARDGTIFIKTEAVGLIIDGWAGEREGLVHQVIHSM